MLPAIYNDGRVAALYNDTCLTHFWNILKGMIKQTSLDRFLLKRAADKSEESVANKSNVSEDD